MTPGTSRAPRETARFSGPTSQASAVHWSLRWADPAPEAPDQHAILLASALPPLSRSTRPRSPLWAPCGLIEPLTLKRSALPTYTRYSPPLQRHIPLVFSVATALIPALFSGCNKQASSGCAAHVSAPWPRQSTPPRKQRLPPPQSSTPTCLPQDVQRRLQPLSRPTQSRDSTFRLTPASSTEIPTTATIPWLLQNLLCHTNPLPRITSCTVTLRRKLCLQNKHRLRAEPCPPPPTPTTLNFFSTLLLFNPRPNMLTTSGLTTA